MSLSDVRFFIYTGSIWHRYEVQSATPNSTIHVFIDLALWSGAQLCWKRKGPATNCSHTKGTKGPTPAVRQEQFFLQQSNPDYSVRFPDGEARFVTTENTSPLLWSPVVVCFTPLHLTLCIALDNVWLGCSCWTMEISSTNLSANCSSAKGNIKFGGV